jgi:hypothetical protein
MKLIKKAEAAKTQIIRNIGDNVIVVGTFFDGRTCETVYTKGTVIKVNRITLDIKDDVGNVYRVDPRKEKVVTEEQMCKVYAR